MKAIIDRWPLSSAGLVVLLVATGFRVGHNLGSNSHIPASTEVYYYLETEVLPQDYLPSTTTSAEMRLLIVVSEKDVAAFFEHQLPWIPAKVHLQQQHQPSPSQLDQRQNEQLVMKSI
jgi:hypothetical protein